MPTESVVTLIAAGLAFLASVIAVVVSAYNARFARFALERWWERKAEGIFSISWGRGWSCTCPGGQPQGFAPTF
jgi:ABC-type Fe3+ transport system permease subunit